MEALLANSRPHKSYPHLEAFLEKKSWELPVDSRRAVFGVIGASVLAASLSGTVAILNFAPTNLGVTALAAFVLLAGLFITFKIAKRAFKPMSRDEVRRVQAHKIIRELGDLHQHRRLHRNLDPVALQVLEAGSYHWSRCHAVLDKGEWSSKDLPDHWTNLRIQAKKAADDAMQDLVLLCGQCVGDPQRKKEDDLKGVFRDFVDLDIADALMGLKQMANADWTAYAHRSPQMESVFPAAKETAEKLQQLADELEAKDTELASDPLLEPGMNKPIDLVLSDLRAVQQAESELDHEHLDQH